MPLLYNAYNTLLAELEVAAWSCVRGRTWWSISVSIPTTFFSIVCITFFDVFPYESNHHFSCWGYMRENANAQKTPNFFSDRKHRGGEFRVYEEMVRLVRKRAFSPAAVTFASPRSSHPRKHEKALRCVYDSPGRLIQGFSYVGSFRSLLRATLICTYIFSLQRSDRNISFFNFFKILFLFISFPRLWNDEITWLLIMRFIQWKTEPDSTDKWIKISLLIFAFQSNAHTRTRTLTLYLLL